MKNIAIKPLLTAAFGLTLALAGAVHAQAPSGPQAELTPEHFAKLDRNGDGGISREEYEQFMRESFQKLDTDGNQRLSRAEAGAVLTPEQFDAVDANNDGELTLDEFIAHTMRDFDRHDYDGDGMLRQ
ncbi:EF-hand domain-containing protein [Pusillimonas sp.]|uniref:EF-hand domain-containing protein n=1 Tax=Pusillimonas sp. TaxID=3040095 RepID=UPI0037CC9729